MDCRGATASADDLSWPVITSVVESVEVDVDPAALSDEETE
jgi:hypothetical protein